MNDQSTRTIVLGGGCFWCTQAVLQSLDGVRRITPGYCGGHVDSPSYEQVCTQKTGHVEVVEVVFDPEVLPLEQLLLVFFATHDPTTLDRQGSDVGPQYASTIFYQSDAQRETIERVMTAVEKAATDPVVTRIRAAETFWPAEAHHNDYYRNNTEQRYCRLVIAPKLARMRQHFSDLLQS